MGTGAREGGGGAADERGGGKAIRCGRRAVGWVHFEEGRETLPSRFSLHPSGRRGGGDGSPQITQIGRVRRTGNRRCTPMNAEGGRRSRQRRASRRLGRLRRFTAEGGGGTADARRWTRRGNGSPQITQIRGGGRKAIPPEAGKPQIAKIDRGPGRGNRRCTPMKAEGKRQSRQRRASRRLRRLGG